jgi:hypothetical protein
MWVLTYYYSLILSLSCYDFLTIALLLSFSGSMGESFRLSTFSKLRKEFINRLVRFMRPYFFSKLYIISSYKYQLQIPLHNYLQI